MSLIRYLSSGSRGLTKGAPPMGRYRLPDGRLIPDFGSAKNPFTPKSLPPQDENRPADGVTARAASTQAAPPSPASLPGPTPKSARLRLTGQRIRGLMGGLRSRMGALTSRLRAVWALIRRVPGAALERLPRRKAPVRFAATAASPVKRPVQGELSLETVRVVRNDLTDTDYEVVCSETATASPVKRVPQTVPLPVRQRPLGRLAERLFSQKVH